MNPMIDRFGRTGVWQLLTARIFAVLFIDLPSSQPALAQEPGYFSGHNGAVMMAAFAEDNDRVVTASSDLTAKLWDVKTGLPLQSWGQHTGPLYCLSVSGDGRTLVTGAQDNTLRIWSIPLSHPIRRLVEPGPAVSDLAYSSDGKSLLAGSVDKSVRLIDIATPVASGAAVFPAAIRQGHVSEVELVAYRNDGVCFASADASGQIVLWSPDLETPLGRWSGHQGHLAFMGFSANNQQLITAGDDGSVRTWQLMPTLPKMLATADAAGQQLVLVNGQSQAIMTTATGSIRLMNLQTGETLRELPKPEVALSDLAMAPNNAFVLTSTADGKTRLVNFNDGTVLGSVAGHVGAVTDAAVFADAQRFATAGIDGTVRLWKTPVPATALPGHSAPIRGVVSAASGQWSATFSDDMTTRVWNASGGTVSQLGNHTQPVKAIAVRDDDALLATGDAEGTVWIWNPANGSAEGVVTAHQAAITALAFSADRTSLITAAADGVVRSWTLPLPKQKPAAGEEPLKPKWEFKVPDSTAVAQLKRLSQDQGLLVVSAGGAQILRLKWDGTAGTAINSPVGAIRRLDVAAGGATFLATSDAGHIHVFAADGTLQKTIPPVAGLTSVKFNRDGKQLLICDGQPRVRIMSIETGRVQEEIPLATPVADADWIGAEQKSVITIGTANEATLAHRSLLRLWEEMPGGATSVTFVPNQQQIAAAGADGKLRLWSLTDGAIIKTFEGSTASITEIAVTPNGQTLCAVGEDKTLQIWKMADAVRTFSLEHPQVVRSVTVSADSTRVATGCVDGLVRVFDIASGALLESFREHAPGTAVQSVRYVNDSATLISTGDDKTLQTMKTSVIRSLPVHAGEIQDLAIVNGGAQTLTCGVDGKVVLRNLTNGNVDRNFAVGDRKPTAVASRPDSQRVAAGFDSGDVLIWNANNGEQVLLTFSFGSPITAISWSTDNRNLLVSTADNVVRVLGPSLPSVQPPVELVLHQQFTTEAAITDLLFSPDGRSIWTSLANGRVDEWSYAGPQQLRQFNHGGPVYGVDSNRDGSTVISCSTDQTVRVWDTVTGQQKFQLNGHTGAVHAIAMSPDETFAVSSGADGTLRLWDIVGGRQLKQLTTYTSTMYSVSVHPQGALIAAAGADRKVHVLDMITGTEQRTLDGHTDYIHCVTFSPNGEQILSYGYSGQLKLWNTADGRLLYETRVGRVGNYAQFAPDGHRIVVANGDATASVHQLP